jgi:hypothetical protein
MRQSKESHKLIREKGLVTEDNEQQKCTYARLTIFLEPVLYLMKTKTLWIGFGKFYLSNAIVKVVGLHIGEEAMQLISSKTA